MNLNEGATIALDKKIGEPVEIMVNGRRIARGEITVLENDDTRFRRQADRSFEHEKSLIPVQGRRG